ncbi:MAG: SUMF1/EgtB/PvdO family nonheme iron enzyme [Ardenticatenales bacterium]|nr:SUMF1/EgtB/PvdO family nonheme iron enzyme [Ardenticatenales bacterium]
MHELVLDLSMSGSANTFAQELVRKLQGKGRLESTGQPALVSLLRELRQLVKGHADELTFVEGLLHPYREIGQRGRKLNLFISYRRKSWPFTQSLARDLAQAINADIFVDIDSIDEANFEQSILRHLRAADALLLVISEDTFSDRIHNKDDWVRRELEIALSLDKPIILVALDGRLPPATDKLPASLHELPKMQAIFFYPDYWQPAIDKLAAFLATVTTAKPTTRRSTMTAPSGTAAKDVMRTISADEVEQTDAVPIEDPSPSKTFFEALRALETENFDKAIFLLEELSRVGFRVPHVSIANKLTEAKSLQQRSLELEVQRQEYRWIANLADHRYAVPEARRAWQAFREAYPFYQEDNENLRQRLARQPFLEPTAEQQTLLNMLLDPNVPPPERAEAGRKLAQIGDPRMGVGLDVDQLPMMAWIPLPAATLTVGGDKEAWNPREGKQVSVGAFKIAKYPITNAQYARFVEAGSYRDARYWEEAREAGHWNRGILDVYRWTGTEWAVEQRRGPANYGAKFDVGNAPRVGVSWYEAVAFCRWLTEQERAQGWLSTDEEIRLPTEDEWEYAARGTEGRIYPWGGSEYESGRANIDERHNKDGPYYLQQTSAVGIYPQGDTPEGISDMSGNVWEWTGSNYEEGKVYITLRGGSWFHGPRSARAAARDGANPRSRYDNVGFRVILAPLSRADR